MIDLINDSIVMDFAFINSTNFEGVGERPFDMIIEYNRNFVSGMKKYTDTIEQKMKTFYDAYADAPAEGEGE